MLKYPCLVLDHDDTVVQSEATVNYPFFCYILNQFRPGTKITLHEYTEGCFRLGFADMCRKWYNFTEQEIVDEYHGWQKYIVDHIPAPFPDIGDIIRRLPFLHPEHHTGLRDPLRHPPRRHLRLGLTGGTAEAQPVAAGADHGKIRLYPVPAAGGGRYEARLGNGAKRRCPHRLCRLGSDRLPGNHGGNDPAVRLFLRVHEGFGAVSVWRGVAAIFRIASAVSGNIYFSGRYNPLDSYGIMTVELRGG